MNATHQSLATLANKMMLTPAQAVALPTTITVVARRMGWTESQAVSALMTNSAAREYVAGIARDAITSI